MEAERQLRESEIELARRSSALEQRSARSALGELWIAIWELVVEGQRSYVEEIKRDIALGHRDAEGRPRRGNSS